MALDNVIQAILDDGKKEVERTLSEGKTERNKLINEAKIEAQNLKNARNKEGEKYIARLKTQEIARAEIDSKKLILRAQKESLDEVYKLALQKLSERWGNKLIENILKRHSSEIKNALVFSNEKDRLTVEKSVVSYGGRFGGTIDCAGGLIIENKDRTVSIDYRLETILKELWDDSVTEVTTILWGDKISE